MEKYTIHEVEHEGILFYCVYENASEQVVDFYVSRDDAVNQKKFLDDDGAFSGFTPSFILKKVTTPEEINTKFEEL